MVGLTKIIARGAKIFGFSPTMFFNSPTKIEHFGGAKPHQKFFELHYD